MLHEYDPIKQIPKLSKNDEHNKEFMLVCLINHYYYYYLQQQQLQQQQKKVLQLEIFKVHKLNIKFIHHLFYCGNKHRHKHQAMFFCGLLINIKLRLGMLCGAMVGWLVLVISTTVRWFNTKASFLFQATIWF